MCNTRKCRQIGKNCYHNHGDNQYQHRVECFAITKNATEQSPEASQYHTFRTLHKAYFAFQSQPSARART